MRIPEKALIQAPLARYTRYPFRVLAAENGAHFTISELVNARGLFEHFNSNPNTHTQWLLYTDELESNVGIQLFGNDPLLFYKA
ncbi:MAG: tRNA-dihydrouridine synthase, partial [Candidatus Heimdallarchaeota archaeon]|nr:tRNA-dihydrouridine synthase [Candidatus Heimdallarchaeota archaeon]